MTKASQRIVYFSLRFQVNIVYYDGESLKKGTERWKQQETEIASSKQTQSQSMVNEVEVGQGCELSKPVPSDVILPVSVYHFRQITPPSWN